MNDTTIGTYHVRNTMMPHSWRGKVAMGAVNEIMMRSMKASASVGQEDSVVLSKGSTIDKDFESVLNAADKKCQTEKNISDLSGKNDNPTIPKTNKIIQIDGWNVM